MPTYASWSDVPVGERNYLYSLKDQFGLITGFQVDFGDAELLEMANGGVMNLTDMGQWATQYWPAAYGQALGAMPWAQYGIGKDEYQALATTYGTEYKKVTGKDIDPDALHQAFLTHNLVGGGLLSGSQYLQQLMNDAAIQKHYGWVKYGMDYSAWTQQKLQSRTAFGRDISDAEASTLLQYHQQTQGPNLGAVARPPREASAGAAQSVVR